MAINTMTLRSPAPPKRKSLHESVGGAAVQPGSPAMFGTGNAIPSIRLLRDECLVRLEKPEAMSGRIWIPESAKREDFELYVGTVLNVGPGRLRTKDGALNPSEVQIGDRVLFYWHHGEAKSAVKLGDDMRVLAEWQIQARWPGDLTLKEAMRASCR